MKKWLNFKSKWEVLAYILLVSVCFMLWIKTDTVIIQNQEVVHNNPYSQIFLWLMGLFMVLMFVKGWVISLDANKASRKRQKFVDQLIEKQKS